MQPHATIADGADTEAMPAWLLETLGIARPGEGERIELNGAAWVVRDGMLRACATLSDSQDQTGRTFAFKWGRRDTYESADSRALVRRWLRERYGDIAGQEWFTAMTNTGRPLLLDAGCGAGFAALELLDSLLPSIRYLGVDISDAVDVARQRFATHGRTGAFLQADINAIPLPPGSVDIILSEGVMHHTDSTETAFRSLVPLLKPGGRFLFYVYRRKGPLREFSDDHIRARLQDLPPEEAWRILMPLTKLGQALGRLDAEIEVPEAVDLLGIPAGRHSVQRLFYWYVCKAFYRPEMTLDEMNHINFDWFAPRNAHRHTEEEIRSWCADVGLEIERERIEDSGITVIAAQRCR